MQNEEECSMSRVQASVKPLILFLSMTLVLAAERDGLTTGSTALV